ncbi:hypothetical protein D0B54_14405 [Solimonas sp. K1W22B-7]|uniref:hypothetical protein n=1 Tax=Solimonas sp. K1W22B-7 TaxID=2303331 RepID=UPI000E3301C6|nr:hypothetical protein [Solimonas sp. K1W22B-7]AXQ29792.1 hypothetical protein D0B54_14405 [Solimonas sp. K1W22B-7]
MDNPTDSNWGRAELLHLLSVCGTLAGLSITIVAFMHGYDRARSAATIVDDMLALCAALYLVCIYLIFWALRTPREALLQPLIRIIDAVFLAALTTMTVAAFVTIYTIL